MGNGPSAFDFYSIELWLYFPTNYSNFNRNKLHFEQNQPSEHSPSEIPKRPSFATQTKDFARCTSMVFMMSFCSFFSSIVINSIFNIYRKKHEYTEMCENIRGKCTKIRTMSSFTFRWWSWYILHDNGTDRLVLYLVFSSQFLHKWLYSSKIYTNVEINA